MKRVIINILDSVGCGAQPDAAAYGDEGANTLLHIYQNEKPHLPNLEALGLLSIVRGTASDAERARLPIAPAAITGAYGRALAKAAGKDTTTGHWEIAGAVLTRPFPTYPHGFPAEVLEPFKAKMGRDVLANIPASGTEIIERYGDEHMKTGALIVYTSADSVFQIAAHEDIVPIEALYEYSRIARALLQGDHAVGRVIARPFVGEPGSFVRTARRKDFSLEPTEPTMLDAISAAGLPVVSVGKISDIFAGRGITDALASKDNDMGMSQTLAAMRDFAGGLIFTNLVDFDMKYGHRNDSKGYAAALEHVDRRLPEILAALKDDDLLVLAADHGCDPFYPGTDHTRESVPVLAATKSLAAPVDIGVRTTFADIGATVLDWLDLPAPAHGKSFGALLNGA